MAENVIKKGDPEWQRLFDAWKSAKGNAGWLDIRGALYRVIVNDDDSILFIPQANSIDNMYGSTTQGVPQ